MSKRIGLLNLQYIDNYGANMISYAMESVCHELSPDDEVHTINYSIDENIIYLQSNTFKNLCVCYGFKHAISTRLKSFVKRSRFVLLNNRISRPIKERFKRAFGIKSVAARSSQNTPFQNQRSENFQKFRENHLNLTKKYNDESFINDGFGAVIVGSDVVWKPQRLLCKAVNKVFFLKSNNNINRIAYAASLGISDIEQMNRLKEYYQKAIDDFNYVSIRESSGRDYIQSLFPDRIIHNCIDPVFLCSADEYEKLVPQQCADDKYIYAYILGKNPDAINYVNCIAKEKNLKIYYHSNSYFEHGENTYTDGPCEFLQRIKNAEYVITDSFHGTAFSIIFKKQFFSFTRGVLSVRLENFMTQIGLKSRLLSGVDDTINIDDRIPYEETWKYLNEWIRESKKYLKDALNQEENK